MLLLVPFKAALAADPDEDPIHIKTVTFQTYKGGASQIILKDDEGGEIVVWQPSFTEEKDWVTKWEEGESFDIVQQRKGVSGLVRARDKKFIKVYFYSDFHPIKVLRQQCFDVEFTTSGMVGCEAASAKRWEKEYDYMFVKLEKILPRDVYDGIKKMDALALQYRKEAMDAYRKYATGLGTFGRVRAANYYGGIIYKQFQLLKGFAGGA